MKRSDLGTPDQLVELGRGNEGIVYRIPGDSGRVYKEYTSDCSSGPSQQALEALIQVRLGLSDADRAWLDQRAAWPRETVHDGPRMVGFTMEPLPAALYRRYGMRSAPKLVVCSWMYLAMQDPSTTNPLLVDEIPMMTSRQVWALILDLSRLIELLHRHDVVLGDMSGGNLLWTDTPAPQSFLIDCDSFRLVGSGGVGTPKQTPDWDDPILGGAPTNKESDIYKLGLAAFRAIAHAKTDRPTPTITGGYLTPYCHTATAADVLAGLIGASVGTSNRPTASDWVSQMAQSGRSRVAMRPMPTQPPSGILPPAQASQRSDIDVSNRETDTGVCPSEAGVAPLLPPPTKARRRKGLLTTVAVLAVLIVVAGVVLSRNGGGGDSRSIPIDQATAEAALLTLEDFPVGWTESPIHPPDGEGRVQWAECVGNTGDGVFDLGGVRASSGSFDGYNLRSIENTVSIANPATVDEFIRNYRDDECIRRVVESGMAGTMENVRVSSLDLSPVGDQVIARRITGVRRGEDSGVEIVVEVFADLVVVQIDNAFTALEFYSIREAVTGQEPFEVEDIDRYVALAARRLDGRGVREASTPDVADDSEELLQWLDYGITATNISADVVGRVAQIATDADSDPTGWVTGDYADEAAAASNDAAAMLAEWNERPQPVGELVAKCDSTATELFETTSKIADDFSDMAIEGSTDSDRLDEIVANLAAFNDIADEHLACIEELGQL